MAVHHCMLLAQKESSALTQDVHDLTQEQTCQKISQTGSVCLPVAAVEEYRGFVGRRTSKTLTEPS